MVHEEALHRAIRRRGAMTVVCSEEEKQLAELNGPGFHLSSGPRAFLEYLERLSLPGITALDPSER
jgi:3-phosphoglycerate kinase